MLRSITRSKAVSEPKAKPRKVASRKVRENSVSPEDAVRAITAGVHVEPSAEELSVESEIDDMPMTEDTALDEDQEAFLETDEEYDEEDEGDEGLDAANELKFIEASGPGLFLIRRNEELILAISSLRREVEAMRRVVENGKDTAADRIVRAVDRAETSMTRRSKGVRSLLTLLALLNIALIGLAIHEFWPLSFLPTE